MTGVFSSDMIVFSNGMIVFSNDVSVLSNDMVVFSNDVSVFSNDLHVFCNDVSVFSNDVGPDFECVIEVYSHKLHDDLSIASTPKKIKKKINEISSNMGRSVGKRLSGMVSLCYSVLCTCVFFLPYLILFQTSLVIDMPILCLDETQSVISA